MSSMNARSAALALALCFFAASCDQSAPPAFPQRGLPTGTLTIRAEGSPANDPPTAVLAVEIAETDVTRPIGLMGRTSLAPDAGMAFLSPDPSTAGFWMKDTLIPLSIAFWNTQGRILEILDMQPCATDSCPLYTPREPYVGAVEVNQGYFEANGIGVGDTVGLER